MRYYSIEFTKDDGSPFYFQSLGGPLTSLLPTGPQNPVNGLTNPAALQVEFDLPVANYTDPVTASAWLRIWGLGLQDIGQAAKLTGLGVKIFAGMAKGLPLANPSQAGLVMQGKVYQGIGNWIGTEQTVEMNFVAGGSDAGSPNQPTNFPFVMPKGTTLGAAIGNTLKIAFPSYTQSVSVRSNLVLDHDQNGQYQSLGQFADFVNELSQGIVGNPGYPGITIAVEGTKITVTDGSSPPTAKSIAFQDLIGQPTWVGPNTVSVATVLRSDVHVGDVVSLPKTIVTTTTAALQSLQDQSAFSGDFLVVHVQHYGHSRQPDASAWNTRFQVTQQVKS